MKYMINLQRYFTAVLVVSCIATTIGQDGLRLFDNRAMEGYTLYQTGSTNKAILVNNCGNLIHEWLLVASRYHPKLLPNGNIVYIEDFSRRVIEKNWNGNLVNEITIDDTDIRLNYEVIVLPNGNYLCLARREFSVSQFEALGYNYGFAVGTSIGTPSQVDIVVEIDRNSGEIIWQWDISDHVIQERDPSKGNFGVVANHPELLNMDGISTFDWTSTESFMINGFDYNPELDQIALSVRKMSEVVIIDHSTTTEQAAGHSGGNSGKGGDILYRWGNPQNYGRGTNNDRYLYFQHNPNWIKNGPHAGKLIMYNNGLNRPNTNSSNDYSTIPIIDTGVDGNGNYSLPSTAPYGPSSPDEDYSKVTTGNDFFSGYTSAGRVLANGNVLVTVGGSDRAFEMLPDGTVVWDYGLVGTGLTFRVEKYALDYSAFIGRDLTPGDVLESPPSTVNCVLLDVVDTYFDNSQVWITENQLRWSTDLTEDLALRIYTLDGKLLMDREFRGNQSLDFSDFTNGIYFVNIKVEGNNQSITYKVIK